MSEEKRLLLFIAIYIVVYPIVRGLIDIWND